jgi:hypothetical protein
VRSRTHYAPRGHAQLVARACQICRGRCGSASTALLSTIAPSIGKLCTLTRPRAFAGLGESRAAFVDRTGRIQLLEQSVMLAVAVDPRLAATVAAFLASGNESTVGMWRAADTWLRVRLDRVDDSLLDSHTVALVT